MTVSPCTCWWTAPAGGQHRLVDSTGLKLCGAGEWLVEKHGTKTRRPWRKLHIGMDAETGQIVAATLTTKDVDDGAEVSALLDQVAGSVASFTGVVHRRRCRRPARRLQRRRRAPSHGGRHRAAAFYGRAERDGRGCSHTAGSPSAVHRRARTSSLAESLRLRRPCPSRACHRQVQAGDGLRSRTDQRRATEADVAVVSLDVV